MILGMDDHINPRALEGFARAFDRVVMGKYGHRAELPTLEPRLQKFEQQVIKTLLVREQAQLKPAQPVGFWRRVITNIKLRRDLIKIDIH